MKKVIMSLAVLLASLTTSLFALEWGGLIKNDTMLSTPDFKQLKINQANELYMWANGPLTKDQSLRFAAEGMYRFQWDTSLRETENKGITHILDVSLLKLNGSWVLGSNKLTLDFGRFNYSDMVGAYFMQQNDGLGLRYDVGTVNLGFYAGYTGLQNSHRVLLFNDFEELPEEKTMLYDLSYAFVPLMFDVTFSNVGPLVLGFQGSYFFDTTKNKQSQAYATLLLGGMMGNIGQYTTSVVVGSNNFKDLMMFASANVTFFVNDSFLLSLGGEYASGKNESMNIVPFKPITVRPVGIVDNYDAMCITPSLKGMFMVGDFLFTLTEKLSMSMLDGKSLEVNNLDNTLEIIYNVFSDLQLKVLGNASLNWKDMNNSNYSVMVEASLSF